MESSISAEMPPAAGVFHPDKPRPFITKKVKNKLQKFKEVCEFYYKEFIDMFCIHYIFCVKILSVMTFQCVYSKKRNQKFSLFVCCWALTIT